MKKQRRHHSMYDEYYDLIVEKLNEGLSVKDIFDIIDHDSGFYEYGTLLHYINVTLCYKRVKADCEHCENIIWVYSPTARKKKPVCLARKRIMRTDFKDKPYRCKDYKKMRCKCG